MAGENQRYECCKTRLNKHLQSITSQISTFFALIEVKTPMYIAQAERLWELSQRERFINGKNATIAALLFSASQDAYQPITQFIKNLKKTQREIKNQVEKFEQEKQLIIGELCQAEQVQPRVLSIYSDWSTWCEQVLDFIQTHLNYLELQTHALLPNLIKNETVENIKSDMQICKIYREKFSLSLVQFERQTLVL